MSIADEDVIVEIPSDAIQLGHDKDGLPRTDPGKETSVEKPVRRRVERAEPDESALAAKAESERVAALERDLETERAARAAAEDVARAASAARAEAETTAGKRTDQAMRAHWAKVNADHAKVSSDYQQIAGAISATQAEALQAEKDYIAASELGDHAKAAAAQRIMAKAEAALIQLENGRTVVEREREAAQAEIARVREAFDGMAAQPKAETRPEPKAEPKPQTPDDWINTARSALGNDGAAWLRSHKEFVTDPKLNKKLLRFADEFADDHGPDALKSAEFRKALDAKFFPDESDMDDDDRDDGSAVVETEKPKVAPKPKATVSAAPVSRGNGFFSSRNPNASQVKLPPKLANFVRQAGLNPTEYALGIVDDIKAGKLPKNYLDPDFDHGI